MLRVQVMARSGKDIIKGGVEVSEDGTVADLKNAIQSCSKSCPTALEGSKKLKDYFSNETPQVVFKDLGPQVAYKTLFFFEYLGPLIIYPVFYFFPQIYSFFGLPTRQVTHPVQLYALIAWCFHYGKREFETFFIHHFSHATPPISNLYCNCFYYWGFGAFIAYFVNHPLYTPVSKEQMYVGFVVSAVSQISNFYCHIILKNLRSPDGKGGYQIPSGFLFNYITCANYTTELYQWNGFNIATQTLAGYLFLGAAAYIMTVWALQKHKCLRKTFDGRVGHVPKEVGDYAPLL